MLRAPRGPSVAAGGGRVPSPGKGDKRETLPPQAEFARIRAATVGGCLARAPIDPQGYYHVTSQGNFGRPLFETPQAHELYLALYGRTAAKFGWITVAWTLLWNHHHFLIKLTDGGLSEGMRVINHSFSRRVNAMTGRTGRGHLFKHGFYAGPARERVPPARDVPVHRPERGRGAAVREPRALAMVRLSRRGGARASTPLPSCLPPARALRADAERREALVSPLRRGRARLGGARPVARRR